MENTDKIFELYKSEYNKKCQNEKNYNHEKQKIILKKQKELKVIQSFLSKFVEYDLHVNNKNAYSSINISNQFESKDSEKFIFYLIESSKSWSPGVSIYFEHPAEVEIAIPNNQDEEGIVVICVSSQHPDKYLLEQKFYNYNQVCEALAIFLSKSTTSIKEIKKNIKKELKSKNPYEQNLENNYFSINDLDKKNNPKFFELFNFK